MEINLEGGCGTDPYCAVLAAQEFHTLDGGGYHSGMSVMPLPLDVDDYLRFHKTFRRRAAGAARLGYTVERTEPALHYEDYMEINRSKAERQGRPMRESYTKKKYSPGLLGEPKCSRHHIVEYCLSIHDTVRAYSTIYRCGGLVHVSMFLGHGDYLEDGIMYLLMREIIRAQAANGAGTLFYNYHDSGTAGLQWYKEKIGLKADDVEWILQT